MASAIAKADVDILVWRVEQEARKHIVTNMRKAQRKGLKRDIAQFCGFDAAKIQPSLGYHQKKGVENSIMRN